MISSTHDNVCEQSIGRGSYRTAPKATTEKTPGTGNGSFDSASVEGRFMVRTGRKLLSTFISLLALALCVQAQTATYHLHKEASATTGLFQLRTAAPDGTSLAVQSANLKGLAAGEYLIKAFDTPAGTPNAAGTIPAGSTVSFTLWMRKTTTGGTLFPRAKLRLNTATGTLLATATGTTALTSTLAKYTFTATTSSNITLTAADRFYVWVGVNLTVAPTTNTTAELDLEGTLNGNYDSFVVIPSPVNNTPTIGGISPAAGPTGTSVTVSGTNFGATQGASTITFNGVAAAPTSWSATSIVAPVPVGATSGPVVVTVNGAASNSSAFSVGEISGITGNVSRAVDGAPIAGAQIRALQAGVIKATSTTGANGGYTITNLLVGTYDVEAAASGYETQSQSGKQISAGSPATASFALTSAQITYVYDELGRLVGVIDPNGERVTYVYDAVGNLTSISRQSAAQTSIIEFTPNSGAVGSQVTIYGSGFSSTPAQNTVKFNGVAAAVASSTATSIVTSVPAGATTGTISVTTPSGTATSSAAFVVGTPSAPSITSFTPNAGSPGSAVTITGTNFQTLPSSNRVAFNGVRASVNSATATSISATIPNGASSGRISVTTPDGKAVSANDIYIPPAPFAGTDVETTGRVALGEVKTVSINTANKVAMLLFDATAGQRVSLDIQSSNIPGYTYVYIYKPDNTQLTNTYVYQNGTGFIDALTLPTTGTYTVIVDPEGANTGNLTFRVNDATNVNGGTITPGGASVTTATTVPGQNAQVTFNGTAGQKISLDISAVTIPGTYIYVQNPNGSTLAYVYSGTGGAFMDTQTLPADGAYTILVDPSNTYTGSATLKLYDVPANGNTPITPGGAPVTIGTTVPGQNATLTFSGTYGQRVSLSLSGVTIPSYSYVYLLKPDGTQLTNTYVYQNGTALIDTQVLPMPGTYTILVDPQAAYSGNMTLQLNAVNDVTATITPGGAPATVTTTVAGQNARVTFAGTEGQRVSLNLTGVTIPGSYVTIFNPDGSTLAAATYSGTGGVFLDPRTLPVSGAYTILLDPQSTYTGSATLTLYDVPADNVGAITPGTPVTVVAAAPGHNPRLTFNGTYGQRVSVSITSSTIGNYAYIYLLRPDGSQVTNTYVYQNNTALIDVQVLSMPGTYTLLVDPQGANTGSMTLQLNDLSDVSATITTAGAPVTITTTSAGQNAKITFNGAAGQRVSLNVSGVTIPSSYVSIISPDNSALIANTHFGTGGVFLEARTLPVNGTYTILVDPQSTHTGSATLTLYDVPADNVGTITAGTPVTVAATAPGHNPRLTFNGAYGQRVSLSITGSTIPSYAYIYLLKPDGSQVTNTYVYQNGTGFIDMQTLPMDGTYTVMVDPQGANTGSMALQLNDASDIAAGTITPAGAPVTVSPNTAGQNAKITFNGTEGQRISLNVSGVTIPSAYVYIFNPDGSQLVGATHFGTGGVFVEPRTLPANGTYSILVDPQGGYTGNATLTLYDVPADVSGALTPGASPITATMSAPGQNARLTFSGAYGQRVSLGITGSTIPSYTYVYLLKPDGSQVTNTYVYQNGTALMDTQTLPLTGTYTVLVDPQGMNTGSMSLQLNDATDIGGGTITPDGASVTVSTTTAGQGARVTFSGTTGQRVSLSVTGVTISGAYVYLLNPDGTNVAYVYTGTGGTFMDTQTLQSNGTYTILVDPQGTNTGNATLTLYNVPSDQVGTITPGGSAVTVTATAPGQNPRLTFSATAGQRVSINLGSVTIPSYTYVYLLRPDGSQITNTYVYQNGTASIATQTLPVTGTYTIMADPQGTYTGSMSIGLTDGGTVTVTPPVSDVTGTITPGGAAVTTTTTTAGQNARLTFSGTYGQRVSLSITGSTIGNYAYIYLLRPDSSQVTNTYVYQNGTGFIDTQLLNATGTFTLLVDPEGANTGSMTMQLHDASEVNAGSITPGGAAVTTSVATAGKNAVATFSGTAGQRVSLSVSGVTIPGSYVYLKAPDGASLAYVYTGTGGAFLDAQTLPASGAYTILVDPQGTYTGSITLTLHNVPADPVGTITPGGARVTLTTTAAGQNARLTFSGTYGQRVSLSITGSTIPNYAYIYLLRPDGSQVTNTYVYQNGTGFIDTQLLNATGTYTILVNPEGAGAGAMSLQLHDASELTAGTITPGGAAVTTNINSAGQRSRFTFNGTSGQRVSLNVTGVSIPGSYVYLLAPDGASLANVYTGTGGAFLDTQTLPASGAYTLLIDPQGTYTGSATLQLYDVPANNVGAITPGTPVTVTAAAPGHNPQLSFNGTYGQRLSLSITGSTIPNYAYVYLLKPDGSQVANTYVYQNGTALIDAQSLPLSGTYLIRVDPNGAGTGNLTVQLNDVSDAGANIAPGGAPVTIATTSAGQNASLTFNGTEGQRVSLKISEVTIPGTYVYLKNPDGATLAYVYAGTGGAFLDTQTLPASGTYTIFIDPSNTYTGSATLTLYDVPAEASGGITTATPVTVTAAAPGHNPRLTFNGTYGQRVSLSITGSTIGNYAYIYLLRPDGSQVTNTYVYQNGTGFIDMQLLNATGTFTLLVDPEGANTGSVTMQLHDASEVNAGSITPGGAAVTATASAPGQNAKVTFEGVEGQRVTVHLTGNTMSTVTVSLLTPDGMLLTSTQSAGGSFDLAPHTLPTSGTFVIRIDPYWTNAGSVGVSVTAQ